MCDGGCLIDASHWIPLQFAPQAPQIPLLASRLLTQFTSLCSSIRLQRTPLTPLSPPSVPVDVSFCAEFLDLGQVQWLHGSPALGRCFGGQIVVIVVASFACHLPADLLRWKGALSRVWVALQRNSLGSLTSAVYIQHLYGDSQYIR